MYDGIWLHSVLYSSFECVKTFLGVTKVMMWMKITLMIIKKMMMMVILSTFWVCQNFSWCHKDDDEDENHVHDNKKDDLLHLLIVSKLSSVSLQAAARPSTSARKSERVLGAWMVHGWLVHRLVGWLVGQEKGCPCPCCLFGSWFVSLFPFLKTLKTGSQVREYAWLVWF